MNKLVLTFLAITVFIIPWENYFEIPEIGGFIRVFGYISLALAIPAVLKRGYLRRTNRLHLSIGLFILWSMMTLFWTIDIESSMKMFLVYVRVFGMAWLIWEFTETFKDVKFLLQAYVLGCYISILSIFIFFSQGTDLWQTEVMRYTGGGLNPNDFALVLAIGIPMAYYLATSGGIRIQILRWAYWLFCPIAAITILITGSRGGFIAMSIGILFLIATYPKKELKTKLGLLVIGITVLLFAWQLIPEANLLRIMSLGDELRFGKLGGRRIILEAGMKVFWESPIIGMGIGTFISAVGVATSWNVAHNVFLSVLVEGGMIGFMFFSSIPTLAIVFALKMPIRERSLWLAVLFTWLVGVLNLSWEYHKPTWLIFSLLVSQYSMLKKQSIVINTNSRFRKEAAFLLF